MSDSDFTDSEAQSDEDGGKALSWASSARFVPYRMQQVLISWIFIVASSALMLDFAALQGLMRHMSAQQDPSMLDELCNWFGVVSCIHWLLGFIILSHWLNSVGATQMGIMGAYMKTIASIFFNLQPMTGTMNDAMLGGGAGLWWSNLTGILWFHFGNIVSCADFYLHTPPGADKSKGWFYHGNLPVTGMWVYQAATWFLVASNFMACSFDAHFDWAPIQPIASTSVAFCQFAGSGLLLAGSIIYGMWCDAFRNFRNPPLV